MPTNHFSKIVFIQSLCADDPKTGRRVYDDVSAQCVAYQRDISTEFKLVDSVTEFRSCLEDLSRSVEKDAAYPILHIDCHGGPSGLEFADKSCLEWTDLKPLLTRLNIASRLNLFITLAACQGAYLSSLIQPTDRAPMWGMIAPTEDAFPPDLERSFSAFYSEFLGTLDGDHALESFARSNRGAFGSYFVTAQGFLKKVYRKYLHDQRQLNGYWVSATKIRHMLRETTAGKIPDLSDIVLALRNSETAYYEKFHAKFFMADLFPENSSRFPITLDEVVDTKHQVTMTMTNRR